MATALFYFNIIQKCICLQCHMMSQKLLMLKPFVLLNIFFVESDSLFFFD